MSLRRQLQDSTGLVLPVDVVERAVRERTQRLGLATRDGYAPQPGTPEFESLVDLVVVPESWMFRDPDVFETALRFVQRRLLSHPGRQLRLLSLPCAGGEEPYSMAMALARAGIEPGMCRIDAVDLSRAALERARLGRYTRNAFRGADLAFRDR
jgi:chemotaxis protein methyltransferase WspC